MTRPVTMAAKVAADLTFRRGLGFQLRIEGRLLGQFARFADAAGHRGPLTPDLARAGPGPRPAPTGCTRRGDWRRSVASPGTWPRPSRAPRSRPAGCSARSTAGPGRTSTPPRRWPP